MHECKKSTGGEDLVEKDLQFWGAPPEVIEEWLVDREPEVFEVTSDCHEAVKLFLRLQTQWRVSPGGHLIGLDYSGVRNVMESQCLWPNDELFQDLQNMEFSATQCDAT